MWCLIVSNPDLCTLTYLIKLPFVIKTFVLSIFECPFYTHFANSSSCSTKEHSYLLTSCLAAVENMLSSTVKRYMRDLVKTYFGLLKTQLKV